MINNVVLIGRPTKNLELKYTNSNIPVIKFTLAVNRAFADQNGQKNADFISCVVFRKQAENMARYVAKGHLIGIVGRIQTGSYQGNDGNTVYTTDVICENVQFLESKNNNQNNNNNFNNNNFNDNQNNNFAANNQFNQQQPQQQQFGMQGGGVGMNTGFNQNINNNMNANSQYADFGQDFPSGNEEDFLADVINPFKD